MTQPQIKRTSKDEREGRWIPGTTAEREAVREQLERLIASPLLNQSKRYSNLLRYIVEKTLDRASEQLKERTLGIEVFGREPAYDTSADPVVRTTAAQLRRRITQYYSGPGHEQEIVLDLPAGGYTPEFRLPTSLFLTHPARGDRLGDLASTVVVPTPSSVDSAFVTLRFYKPLVSLIGAGLAVATLLASLVFALRGNTALSAFWKPVLESPGSVLVCVGRQGPLGALPAGMMNDRPTIAEYLHSNSVAWPDAITFSSIVGLIRARGHGYFLRKSGATAFSDLRQSPAVLIGGYNNEWIMKLGATLRFRYMRDHDHAWIQDQQNPSQRSWATDFDAPFSNFEQDFGIITRVRDPSTEQITVIASGIAAYGTIAAGEFLTNEKYMEMISERAPRGWDRKNIQVVFSTRVINGNSGPPRILATHYW